MKKDFVRGYFISVLMLKRYFLHVVCFGSLEFAQSVDLSSLWFCISW